MQIDEHHVRERAYYIWENEGRVHGRAASHWIRAEAELSAAAAPAETAVAPRKSAVRTAAKKAAAPKAAAIETALPKIAAPKIAAPKPAKASKSAVTAGLAAKAKPARTPAAVH